MARPQSNLDKGAATEEVLRRYFISLGYFVVRGVPVTVGGDEVTDIDLWLYSRHSPIVRERVNVDIKNKQRAKAMERILVARGIRETFGFDRSIVVTSDPRDVVADFGNTAGVTVFGGDFLKTLIAKHQPGHVRLDEEALIRLLAPDGLGKLDGNWGDRFRHSKRQLLTRLGFDACNDLLDGLPEYFEVAATNPHKRQGALRFAYLVVAMFLASLDYAIAPITFDGAEKRREHVLHGLQFGSEGFERFERAAAHAAALATAVTGAPATQVRASIYATVETEEARFAGLADFFGKGPLAHSLVETARKFESLAYSVPLVEPATAPGDVRAVLGVLADALRLDRTTMLG